MIRFLYIDLFCGAGGTSTGVEAARLHGEQVAKVIACVNHDANAIASHAANHPDALHFVEDIRTLNLDRLLAHVEVSRKQYPAARVVLWAAMKLADYAITEAGFGSDLGAEKFFNIKCRAAGFAPAAVVIVTSTKALKWHGGVPLPEIGEPNLEAVKRGIVNLDAHIANLKQFGPNIVVALNHFHTDTEAEIEVIRARCAELGVRFAVSDGFAKGGEGAEALAREVVAAAEDFHPLVHTYEADAPIVDKLNAIVTKVYGGDGVKLAPAALKDLKRIEELGFGKLPVCVAKTPFSLTADPKALGAPKGFTLPIERLILNAGSGFVVAMSGSIMRMPGLPKKPAAMSIDVQNGRITGLA